LSFHITVEDGTNNGSSSANQKANTHTYALPSSTTRDPTKKQIINPPMSP
jgi:hypothetical protein